MTAEQFYTKIQDYPVKIFRSKPSENRFHANCFIKITLLQYKVILTCEVRDGIEIGFEFLTEQDKQKAEEINLLLDKFIIKNEKIKIIK